MTLADPCPGEDDGTDCDTTTRHPAHVVSVGAERRRVAGPSAKSHAAITFGSIDPAANSAS